MTPTPEQAAVAAFRGQWASVIACPGSGKTETVSELVASLVREGASPSGLVLISFTNAAADELKARVGRKLGAAFKPDYCGTLHGFALRLCRRLGASVGLPDRLAVLDDRRMQERLTAVAAKFGIAHDAPEFTDALRATLPFQKHQPRGKFEPAACEYHQSNFDAGVMDFESILRTGVHLARLWGKCETLIVDEAQDSGKLDAEFYNLLPARRKILVGDPDQSIYGFRGGSPEYLRRFGESSSASRLVLTTNFRSNGSVVAAANRLKEATGLSRQPMRWVRDFEPILGPAVEFSSSPSEVAEQSEVARDIRDCIATGKVGPDGCAVLVRTNSQAAAYRKALTDYGIPVAKGGVKALPQRWGAVRAAVGFLLNPYDETAARECLEVVMDWPNEQVEESAILALDSGISLAEFCGILPKGESALGLCRRWIKDGPTLEALAAIGGDAADPEELSELSLRLATFHGAEDLGAGVKVLTIHGAKGLEWPAVWLPGWGASQFPRRGSDSTDEQARLAFVAITRARDRLRVSFPEQIQPYPGARTTVPQGPGLFWTSAR